MAAVLSFIVSALMGSVMLGLFILLFYYLGGVGVRERSRYAATVILILFVADLFVSGLSVIRVFVGALLLSNFRATWIASHWKPDAEEASLPPRLGETWSDKFVDKLPQWLWPKIRIPYYIFSACLLLLTAIGLVMTILRRTG